MNTDTALEINDLPCEVLAQILGILPLWARNDARLVCRKWFDILNTKSILCTEKLTLLGCVYGTYTVIKVLSKSRRRLLNLEFSEFHFDEYPIKFWKKHGSKIHTLIFSDCTVNNETVYELLTHCKNLFYLSWQNPFSTFTFHEQLFSKRNLDYLIDHEIKNDLCYLNVGVDEMCDNKRHEIINNILKKLLHIFPKIDILKLGDNNNQSLVNAREILLKNSIKLKDILESVTYQVSRMEELHDIPLNYEGLSTHSGTVTAVYITRDDATEYHIHIICSDTCVKSLIIKYGGLDSDTYYEYVISRIFDVYPQLYRLDLLGKCSSFTPSIFNKIAASSLHTFIFHCGKNIDDGFLCSGTTENKIMQYLDISFHDEDFVNVEFLEHCLKTFTNLRVLKLPKLTTYLFQTVWKYQSDLKTLQIEFGSYTDSVFSTSITMEDGSIRSFQNLNKIECLQLNLSEVSDAFFEQLATFLHLRFLNLYIQCSDRLLSLARNLPSTMNSKFEIPIKNFPLLEVLKFRFVSDVNIKCRTWITLVENLKRLRILIIEGSSNVNGIQQKHCLKMFEKCPSLRILRYCMVKHLRIIKEQIYMYDVIKKEVKKLSPNASIRYFIESSIDEL